MLNITQIIGFWRSEYYIEKRRLIIRESLVQAQLGPQWKSTTYKIICRWFFLWCQFVARIWRKWSVLTEEIKQNYYLNLNKPGAVPFIGMEANCSDLNSQNKLTILGRN